ncbi:hypothetical protein Tco_1059791 [Tanacetum coccineum]
MDVICQTSRKGYPSMLHKTADSVKNWNNRFFGWMREYSPPWWAGARPPQKTRDQPQIDSLRRMWQDDQYPEFLCDDDQVMDLFSLIRNSNPTKVKIGTRPRAAHEVPLLTATANRVVAMEETPSGSASAGPPSAVEKLPLDFADENVPPPISEEEKTENPIPTHTAYKRQKRDVDEVKENAPAKVLRMDHVSIRPERSTCGGKSTAAPMEGVSEPDPLSFSQLQPNLEQDIAQSSKKAAVPEGQDSGKSASFTSMVEPPEGIYQLGWGVTNECRLDTPAACQDLVDHLVPPGYFSVLRHIPNEDFLSQYNVNLAQQVAMGSQLRLRFEQETRLLKKAVARNPKKDRKPPTQFSRDLPTKIVAVQHVATLQAHGPLAKKRLCSALKSQETPGDEWPPWCAYMDSRFSQSDYHGIRPALARKSKTQRSGGSWEISSRIATIEAYDLGGRKEITSGSNDTGEGCTRRHNPDLLPLLPTKNKYHVPRADKSRSPEWYVAPMVGSAHHARSDGVPVSVPTVPRGLHILLADAATQTDGEKPSPRHTLSMDTESVSVGVATLLRGKPIIRMLSL